MRINSICDILMKVKGFYDKNQFFYRVFSVGLSEKIKPRPLMVDAGWDDLENSSRGSTNNSICDKLKKVKGVWEKKIKKILKRGT